MYKSDSKDVCEKSLVNKYIHDIRNMRILDQDKINNIRDMSDKDKMNIIIAFNDVVRYFNNLMDAMN
jgi:hypothetical protein